MKIFNCRKTPKPNVADIEALNKEINNIYYKIYTDTYTKSTMNKANYGADFFWNGTLDDSQFDLLYDINQVGKLLFENFTDSPQVLFYRLPKATQSSNQNGTTPLTNQSSYQV